MNSRAHLVLGYMHSDCPESSLYDTDVYSDVYPCNGRGRWEKKMGLSGLTLIMG